MDEQHELPLNHIHRQPHAFAVLNHGIAVLDVHEIGNIGTWALSLAKRVPLAWDELVRNLFPQIGDKPATGH